MKSFFGGSAVIVAALLSSFLLLSATPSAAETPGLSLQQQKQEQNAKVTSALKTSSGLAETTTASESATGTVTAGVVSVATDPAGGLTDGAKSSPATVTSSVSYAATAYSLVGRTASGRRVSKGLIAADPSVLPLGTRVLLDAGSYSGEYLVADTGGSVRGKRIDIWTPSGREAMRFGRRMVKLTVLAYGPRSVLRKLRTR